MAIKLDERVFRAAPAPGGRTAAQLYHIQPYYQRFNQKYNMLMQRLWDPKIAELEKQRQAKQRALAAQGRPGYEPIDLALYQGTSANLFNSGFPINRANQRGNSWQPLRRAPPPPGVALLPATAAQAVKRLALLSGAKAVGFCLLDRHWVYSHYYDEKTGQDYPIRFSDEPGLEGHTQPGVLADGTQVIPAAMRFVVVLVHEMDERGIATAPTLTQAAITQLAYSQIAFSTVAVAEFLRGLGYSAVPSANDTALNIPLAIDAGLGQLGRNAKLITPQFGPRCRLSKVITDLPLEIGHPVELGITQFCDVCLKCARECPARAIPFGPRSLEPVNECNHRGVLQWQVDHHRCYEYWSQVGTNCGICLRVCPFNKGKHRVHDATRWVIKHIPWVDPLMVRLDDWLGYGQFRSPRRFWGCLSPSPRPGGTRPLSLKGEGGKDCQEGLRPS